jgi:hypothetical protein
MEADPRYIASAWTAQETHLQTVLLLLGDVATLVDRTENAILLLRVHLLLR